MAIELKPKSKIKKNWWQILVLVFSLLLFVFLAVSYFYINNLLNQISKDIEDKKIALAKSQSERELEEKLILYESKILVFKDLFENHKKTSNTFALLEKISHPNIWFSEFSFNSEEGMVSLSGQSKNFIDIGQQLILLKEEPDFKEVDLTSISMNDEGKVDFSLGLVVEQGIFK